MELEQYKFCYAGSDMNFAVFSDDPCLAAEPKALLAGKAFSKRFGRMVKKIGKEIKKGVRRDREKKEEIALY